MSGFYMSCVDLSFHMLLHVFACLIRKLKNLQNLVDDAWLFTKTWTLDKDR